MHNPQIATTASIVGRSFMIPLRLLSDLKNKYECGEMVRRRVKESLCRTLLEKPLNLGLPNSFKDVSKAKTAF